MIAQLARPDVALLQKEVDTVRLMRCSQPVSLPRGFPVASTAGAITLRRPSAYSTPASVFLATVAIANVQQLMRLDTGDTRSRVKRLRTGGGHGRHWQCDRSYTALRGRRHRGFIGAAKAAINPPPWHRARGGKTR